VAPQVPTPVATLTRRTIAFLIDGLVLAPVYVIYAVVLDALFGPLVGPGADGSSLVVVAVDPLRVAIDLTLTILTDAAYFAGCWALWNATPGQRLCGVAVRTIASGAATGAAAPRAAGPDRVPLPVATVRWAFLQLLVLCTGTLGAAGAIPLDAVAGINAGWYAFLFFSAALNPLRRGLHDRAAGTIVVWTRARRPG
jgi:uncharacterized RDD family membrane protein YckC